MSLNQGQGQHNVLPLHHTVGPNAAQRQRLREIYDRIYKDLTIDTLLDKYEMYCTWCRDHRAFPKDFINWATYTQNYPQVVLDKIREFLTDFDA